MKTKSTTKKMLQIIALAVIVFILGCAALVYFSPYQAYAGSKQKMVRNSVIINRPPDTVFKFIGNHVYTQAWVTYVDHIKMLSKQEDQKGAHKRYYFNADELGQKFDGILLDVNKNRQRKLLLTNFSDFPFEPGKLIHEQFYRPLKDNKCELCFTVYYDKTETDFLDDFKASIAAYRVQQALRENMENIKAVLEEGAVKKI